MFAPLEHNHRHAIEFAGDQLADVPQDREHGKAGEISISNDARPLNLIGQTTQART